MLSEPEPTVGPFNPRSSRPTEAEERDRIVRIANGSITTANLRQTSVLSDHLLNDDDALIQQEILHLINDHLASPTTPQLPRTLEALREEIQVRSRQDEEREGERDRLAGRVLDGDWTEAERLLGASPGLVRNSKAFLYQLYRQQFLELIEARESQKAFNLLLRRLKPLEHFQSYPSEFRDLSYLLSVRAVSEGGGSFRGWGGTAEGREEIVRELKGMGGSLGGWNGASASAASVGGGKGGGSSKDQSAEAPYVPPGRLMTLLRQAAAWQIYFARYHPKVLPTLPTLLRDYTPTVIPNTLLDTHRTHSANVKCVRFLGADGSRLISGSSDTTISITPTSSAAPWKGGGANNDSEGGGMGAGPSRLFGHRSRIWDLDCQQETSRVASASGDGTVRIWETEQEGRCLAVLGGVANGDTGGGDVYSVRWGKSGKNEVISGGYDKILKLYDVERGQIVKTFTGHSQPVTSTAFGPEGKLLVSGSKDRQIKIWDVSSGVCIRTLSDSLGEISSVDVDWNGQNLLTSSKDNSNNLFDFRMFRHLKRFKTHQNTSKNYIRSSFAHGSLIVGGSEDGLVYIWDTTQSEPLQTLEGHTKGPVYEVVWNDAQSLLASCGEDRTVRTWGWEKRGEEAEDDGRDREEG